MNSSEKKLAKKQLTEEQNVLKALKSIYNKALQDVQKNIANLNSRTDLQNLQSIIYQKKYQEAIEQQVKTVLDNLNNNSYQTIEDYVKDSYVNGYVGNMWLLQQQTGLTCVVPIDERKVVRAYTNDSKISTRYYSQNNPLKGRIAEDVDLLKARIKSNVSRGIASGKTWTETAYDIASGMNSVFRKAMNDAMRIARTEGHRVNQQGFLDAGQEAIKKGAEVVKQWDATLDSVTRPWHQEADGQIREWDEKFLVGGEEMDAPSIGGSAFNVCNCRCQLLQRAKWALDEDELQALEDRAKFFGLDKTKEIDDFKNKYLQLPKNADTMKISNSDIIKTPKKSSDDKYNELIDVLQQYEKQGLKLDYNPVMSHAKQLSGDEIIEALAGGDRTRGSCASVGLAYIGQKQGWNVLDFRDGESRSFFSRSINLVKLSQMDGVVTMRYGDVAGKTSCTLANNFLKSCEVGKEYYLCVGRHASIVRKTDEGVLQYLELQSASKSGWTNFNGNPKYTLTHRFGCSSSSGHGEHYDFMMNITDSDFNTDEFRSLLGYINTAEKEQRKGSNGTIK